jgi:hypothetical protein
MAHPPENNGSGDGTCELRCDETRRVGRPDTGKGIRE